MTAHGYTLFETPLGLCGVAWGERGLAGVALPGRDAAATRASLARRFPQAHESAPPADVQAVIAAIGALLNGEPRDLAEVVLDMAGIEPFAQRVYAAARAIGPGRTATYGEIAATLGDPTQARAVGQALGANPFPIVVPCHRVLAAGGRSGGFSAPGGTRTKLRLLEIEGANFGGGPGLFDRV
jgi:methylated-DNA-[protein]-cysteine S-methyltransferase